MSSSKKTSKNTLSTETPREIRRLNQRINSLRKMNIILLSSLLVSLLALVWLGYSLASKSDGKAPETLSPAAPTATVLAPPGEKIKTGATGKTVAEDQKDALAAATKILQLAGVSPTKASPDERIKRLDASDYGVVTPELTKMIRLTTLTPEPVKAATYQALITMNSVVLARNESKIVKERDADAYKRVFVDPQLGTAFVPISVYFDSGTAFSFEMRYIDGRWMLAPYSLVDAIKLSAIIANGGGNGQALQTPAK